MTRTCPHCGEPLPPDPAQVAAHKRHEQTDARKAYRRDYMRGRRHAAKGRPMEDDPSDAYRAGYTPTGTPSP